MVIGASNEGYLSFADVEMSILVDEYEPVVGKWPIPLSW